MILKWFIDPTNLSKNNLYNLNLSFENDENNRFWIHRINLMFPDLKISGFKEIEQELKEPVFGIINRKIKQIFSFKLEKNIVAPRSFIIQLIARRSIDQQLSPEFLIEWAPQIFQIKPIPIYRAFISRSVRENEKIIPNYISQTIERWGFNTFTVGIPPLKKNYTNDELLQAIRLEIEKADIVFAIATKRDELSNNLQWRTFEWLQSEAAMGFILNKQVLVFVEKGVILSGLASKRVVLQFDPDYLEEINNFFDVNMLQIRENIENRKNTEFLLNSLKGLGILGGLILIGVGAYQYGKDTSKENKDKL